MKGAQVEEDAVFEGVAHVDPKAGGAAREGGEGVITTGGDTIVTRRGRGAHVNFSGDNFLPKLLDNETSVLSLKLVPTESVLSSISPTSCFRDTPPL